MPLFLLSAVGLAVGYFLGRRASPPAPAPVNITFNVPIAFEEMGVIVPDEEKAEDDEDEDRPWGPRFSDN